MWGRMHGETQWTGPRRAWRNQEGRETERRLLLFHLPSERAPDADLIQHQHPFLLLFYLFIFIFVCKSDAQYRRTTWRQACFWTRLRIPYRHHSAVHPVKVSSWLSENCFCQQLHQSDVCQRIEGEPAPSFFISIVNKWELSRHQTRPYFNRWVLGGHDGHFTECSNCWWGTSTHLHWSDRRHFLREALTPCVLVSRCYHRWKQ